MEIENQTIATGQSDREAEAWESKDDSESSIDSDFMINSGDDDEDSSSESKDSKDQDQEEVKIEEIKQTTERKIEWEEKGKVLYGLWTPHWLKRFDEVSGPSRIPQDKTKPLDIFSLLLDPELIESLVVNSNIYAEKMTELHHQGAIPEYLKGCKNITKEDILAVVCALLYMGIVKMPTLYHYWMTDPFYPKHIFSDIITRNRFLLVMRFLNVTNPQNEDDNDKLKKVRSFLVELLANWRKYYYPNQMGW